MHTHRVRRWVRNPKTIMFIIIHLPRRLKTSKFQEESTNCTETIRMYTWCINRSTSTSKEALGRNSRALLVFRSLSYGRAENLTRKRWAPPSSHPPPPEQEKINSEKFVIARRLQLKYAALARGQRIYKYLSQCRTFNEYYSWIGVLARVTRVRATKFNEI